MANKIYSVQLFRAVNATAAGTSVLTASTGVDMLGFEGALIICSMGALTASQVTSLQATDSATNSSYVAITNAVTAAALDADSNKLLVLDVYRPVKRFLSVQVNRATANAAIDGVVIVQYNTKKAPTTFAAAQVSQSKFYLGGS